MADMQIAIRLRREARVNAATELAGFEIVDDDVANEIGGRVGRHD